MTKKQLALEVIRRLKEAYPDSDCTLEYDQAWKLLVSVRLAAQCTDARVNVVVEKLYEKFPGCGCPCSGRSIGDRRDRAPVWTWKKQSEGYQCLHESIKRAVQRTGAG